MPLFVPLIEKIPGSDLICDLRSDTCFHNGRGIY